MSRTLTRREIEGRIADGETIVIVDGMALKLDKWMDFHPGGSKAILHLVGRDATDEVNALHSKDARKRMKGFKIGLIQGPWINFKPPVQGGTFRKLVESGSDDEADLDASSDELEEVGAVSCIRQRSDSGSDSAASEDSDMRDFLLDPQLRRRHQSAHADDTSSLNTSISSHSEDSNDKFDKMKILEQERFERDLATYPSLDPITQDRIVQRYRELDVKLHEDGLYNCNYTAYAWEALRYSLFVGGSMYCLTIGWYILSSILLGIFWHQIAFTAHDAGHMGITHSYSVDTLIGIFIANFCGGLSLGWWKKSHNVHHIVTNEPEHDPDIQHLPFFAIDNRFFSSLYSTYYDRIMKYDAFAQFVVRNQNYLYYPIMALGRFNLYRLSWDFLLNRRGPKKGIAWWHWWVEIVAMVSFWAWFGYGVVYSSLPDNWTRFYYLAISHIVTMPLHVQITLSHFAMSTSDMGETESFPQRMMRTTMDVACPAWLDFFHGGLQFQVVHHLFPRIPRHNLRQARPYVMKYCEEMKLPYAIYGFHDGNKEILGRLEEIAKQAAIFNECQKFCQEQALEGHF